MLSDLEASGIHQRNFYIEPPKPPVHDIRAWLLIGMSFIIAAGFAVYAFMAYLFGEAGIVMATAKPALTGIGALALAIGGEFTTPLTVWEVYRKMRAGECSRWDWMALIASVGATLMTLAIGISSLLQIDPALVDAASGLGHISSVLHVLNLWPAIVRAYGPALLIFVAAADGYANFMETGLYLGSYDARYKAWEKELNVWKQEAAEWAGWAGFGKQQAQQAMQAEQPLFESAPEDISNLHPAVRAAIRTLQGISQEGNK